MSDQDQCVMSFSGKTHSGNVRVRKCDKSRGSLRVVLSVWRNGVFDGEGDEQEIVIPADLLPSVLHGLQVASVHIAKAIND